MPNNYEKWASQAESLSSVGSVLPNETIFKDVTVIEVPDEALAQAGYPNGGVYFPNQKKIFLSDLLMGEQKLRVFCHELAHHKQNLNGRLTPDYNKAEIEAEANRLADEYCEEWLEMFK